MSYVIIHLALPARHRSLPNLLSSPSKIPSITTTSIILHHSPSSFIFREFSTSIHYYYHLCFPLPSFSLEETSGPVRNHIEFVSITYYPPRSGLVPKPAYCTVSRLHCCCLQLRKLLRSRDIHIHDNCQ